MGAVFTEVMPLLKDIEGGYSNDPHDYGGETNWGVTKRSYPNLDIKNLTFNDACLKVYIPDYWDKYQLAQINSQAVANKLFLALINMNPHEAIMCVQRAINHPDAILKIDGVMGQATITAINNSVRWALADAITVELVTFYYGRVQADNSQLVFIKSWLRRALAQ